MKKLCVLPLALAAWLAPAQAATAMTLESYGDVEAHEWSFVAEAKPGEVNHVTMTREADGRWRIRDSGAPIDNAGALCTVVSANEVLCHADNDYGDIYIGLGDGDDTLALPPARGAGGAQIHAGGGEGNDVIQGGDAGEDLTGGDGDDRVLGGAGDDTFTTETGNDVIDGEAGSDTLSMQGLMAPVTADLATTPQRSIENIKLEGGFDHDLTGTGERNAFDLFNTNNARITALGGNDFVRLGGFGTYAIDLGAGNDRVEIDLRDTKLTGTIACGPGTDTVMSVPAVVLTPDCERWWTNENFVSVDPRVGARGGIKVRCDDTTRKDPCHVKLKLKDARGRSLGTAKATIAERKTTTLVPKPAKRRRGVVRVEVTTGPRGYRYATAWTGGFSTTVR